PARRGVRRNFERQPFGDRQTVPLDPDKLARVVAEKAHRSNAELAQDLYADAVIALIRLEAEPLVRFDRVEAFVLQLVRADLVREADAASFLVEIQQNAAALRRDPLHRGVALRTAVAPDRVQTVARQARRVDAHEQILAVADLAAHERDVRLVVDLILERVHFESAVV